MSDDILNTLANVGNVEIPADTIEADTKETETQVSETQEPQTQETESNESETQVSETPETESNAQEPQAQVSETRMTEREFNMREMRKAKENAERSAMEAQREIEALRAKLPNEEEIAADDFIEGKHLTKVQKRMQLIEDENQRMRDQFDLNTRYSDYGNVMTQEAIARLEREEPELAASLALASQGSGWKSAAISTYKAIKKMNLAKDYTKERAIATKNLAKPRTVSSLPPQQKSPISRVSEYSSSFDDPEKESTYLDALAKAKMIE